MNRKTGKREIRLRFPFSRFPVELSHSQYALHARVHELAARIEREARGFEIGDRRSGISVARRGVEGLAPMRAPLHGAETALGGAEERFVSREADVREHLDRARRAALHRAEMRAVAAADEARVDRHVGVEARLDV